MNKRHLHQLSVLAGVVALAGCGLPDLGDTSTPTVPKMPEVYAPKAKAGIPVAQAPDTGQLKPLIAATSRFGSRPNPFLLQANEIKFDQSQAAERLFLQEGTFSLNYREPEFREPELLPEEPQPYRRLMGVVIGDAIVAILETDGQAPLLIRPGMRIPDTDWVVVSIDEEKAVLRRTTNQRPKEVVVRLEQPRPGFGAGAAGAPGQGGFGPGGAGPSMGGASGAGGGGGAMQGSKD